MDKINLYIVICTVYEERKVFILIYIKCYKSSSTNCVILIALDPTKSHYSSILYAVTNFSYASLLILPYFYFLYKKIFCKFILTFTSVQHKILYFLENNFFCTHITYLISKIRKLSLVLHHFCFQKFNIKRFHYRMIRKYISFITNIIDRYLNRQFHKNQKLLIKINLWLVKSHGLTPCINTRSI